MTDLVASISPSLWYKYTIFMHRETIYQQAIRQYKPFNSCINMQPLKMAASAQARTFILD